MYLSTVLFVVLTAVVIIAADKTNSKIISSIALGMTYVSLFIVVVMTVYFLKIHGVELNPKPISL